MNRILISLLAFVWISMGTAQDKPTIYIDIPTDRKPWNHTEWNDSAEQFQFAIVTDRTGGRRPGVFPIGIKKLNLLQPEFVMSVGDLIDGYTRDTLKINAEWKEFMGFIDALEAPFFYVPGNHDITNEVMEEKWMELFGVSYYHFVYKDVLFLCLNSEDNLRGAGRGTIDDEQYEYIKKTLAENSEVKWTLVFLHQPLWVQEDTKRWKDVEKLLENRNHNVFAGHYHRYWKTKRNNGKYIALATTGGGSRLRGKAYGEFDHVVWATMTEEGPILANLFLDGIWDENVVTEELVDLVRNRPFPVRIEPIYLEETNPGNMSASVRATNDSDGKMHVELKGYTNDELFYQFDKTSFVVEPNDVAVFNLSLKNMDKIAVADFSTLKIKAEITYELEKAPNVSFSSVLNYLPFSKHTIPKNAKIKLDGNLKEWKDADWISVENMDGTPFDFKGPTDCSLKFAKAYDDDYFYVALNITDNDLYIKEEGSHWNQDRIVLGLDARATNLSAFNKGEGRGRDWIAYLRTFKKENPVYNENRLPTEVKTEVKRNDTGVTMEIAFPLEYIQKMGGADWSSLRFGLGYYDYDTDDENPTTHFWFPPWNANQDIPGSGMLFKE
ncbi:metallophosphoesterase [Muricauda sp. SCSIO 64092]|uniref:metallophosphoesterase n=1 Tax=Allomuricauda sp. SCSIO 64092 TaxID=2908842 RepID=UPI001FF433DE|nr:metallophosphoesterase [Muricauda sp. SCSIO 64092]UOY05142.1 metallophosphoesterase [Muricauda sp. SCSIO 64092]